MYWVLPSLPSLLPSSFSSFLIFLKLGLHVFQECCELQELLWRGLVSIIRYRVEAKENWRKKAKGKDSLATLLSRVKKSMKAMHKAKKNRRETEPVLSQRQRHSQTGHHLGWVVESQGYWVDVNLNLQGGDFSLPLEKRDGYGRICLGNHVAAYIYYIFTVLCTALNFDFYLNEWCNIGDTWIMAKSCLAQVPLAQMLKQILRSDDKGWLSFIISS